MDNKIKNVITNVLGLLFFLTNLICYYAGKLDIWDFLIGVVASLALFLFKASETKKWIVKALEKIVNKKS